MKTSADGEGRPTFEGKVVLVTGAGRGLGRAIARAFAARGASVAANDLTPVNLDRTLEMIEDAGGRAQGFLGDVSRRMQVHGMLMQIRETLGAVDVLVNNAGVAPRGSLLTLDEWDWERTLAVNLTGPFLLIQAAGRVMADAGGGVIVNVASPQAVRGTLDQRGAYLASKAGLLALTRQAALELAPHSIRVNAVCPGLPLTDHGGGEKAPGCEAAGKDSDDAAGLRQAAAQVVLFLCSPRATFITGEAVVVGPGSSSGRWAGQDPPMEVGA